MKRSDCPVAWCEDCCPSDNDTIHVGPMHTWAADGRHVAPPPFVLPDNTAVIRASVFERADGRRWPTSLHIEVADMNELAIGQAIELAAWIHRTARRYVGGRHSDMAVGRPAPGNPGLE